MIGTMYAPALDVGMLPAEFWDSSLGEVLDRMESFRRREKRRYKEQIVLNTVLANQIAERVCGDEKHPPKALWDYFPDLFDEEEETIRAQREAEEIEEFKSRRRYMAAEINRRRAGEKKK